MEHPALLRSKLFSIGFLFLLACSSAQEEVEIGDALLTKEKGYYCYDGVIFSGTVVGKNDEGDVISKAEVVDGKRHGVFYAWWDNGYQKTEAHFNNGEYHGLVTSYFETGQTQSILNYNNGHEEGLQRIWKSDGRIKANYEVVSGRKYGLTGVKNCINVFEGDSLH